MINSFDARITALQKRFPVANYGWRTEITQARIRRTPDRGFTFIAPELNSHDCKTTAIITARELGCYGGKPEIVGLKLHDPASNVFALHYFTALTYADDVCIVGLTPYDQVLGFYPYTVFPREDFQQMRHEAYMYVISNNNTKKTREVSIRGEIPLEAVLSGVRTNMLYASYLSFFYSDLFPDRYSVLLRVASYIFDPTNFRFSCPFDISVKKDQSGTSREENGRFPQAESRRILKGLEERGRPVLERTYEQIKEGSKL